MELLRDSIPVVSLAVSAAALYARAASSRLLPGLPRFVALLPVITFFAAVPLAFSSSILRFIARFFLGWLGTFKVALLAVPGDVAAVRQAVPGDVAARFLGPAVEPHGLRHPPRVGVRPRVRARGEEGRRRGNVPRVRADARGHGVLPPPATAHRRDGRLPPPPRRVLPGRGPVRAPVGGEGMAAAAETGDFSGFGGVHGGHDVLAVPPTDLPGRGRGDAAGGLGSGAGVLCELRPKAAPACIKVWSFGSVIFALEYFG